MELHNHEFGLQHGLEDIYIYIYNSQAFRLHDICLEINHHSASMAVSTSI